jgi:hypothetical protein
MLLYVHYYDEEVAEEGDNPTLGLILCTDMDAPDCCELMAAALKKALKP